VKGSNGVRGGCKLVLWWIAAVAVAMSLSAVVHAVPVPQLIGPVPQVEANEEVNPAHVELMRFLLEAPEDAQVLRGARIAVLAADGVDGFDLEIPRRYLTDRGAKVDVIVPARAGEMRCERVLRSVNPSGEEDSASFELFIDEVDVRDYDALYLPGHRIATPAMTDAATLAFIQNAVHSGRPVFAIANAPLVLLQAGLLERRRATGDAATFLRLAVSHASATDAPLVEDGSIYTSRDAFDMPALMRELISEVRKRLAR
jgi:protease I